MAGISPENSVQQELRPPGPIAPPPPSPQLDAVVARLGRGGIVAPPPGGPVISAAPPPAPVASSAVLDAVSTWSRLRIGLAGRVPVEQVDDDSLRVTLRARGRSQTVSVRVHRPEHAPEWVGVESGFGPVSDAALQAAIRSLGSPKHMVGLARVDDELVIRWTAFLEGAVVDDLVQMIDAVAAHADQLESRLFGDADTY